jgi:hypothetical protein
MNPYAKIATALLLFGGAFIIIVAMGVQAQIFKITTNTTTTTTITKIPDANTTIPANTTTPHYYKHVGSDIVPNETQSSTVMSTKIMC